MTTDKHPLKPECVSKDLALKHALYLVNSDLLPQALAHIDLCLADHAVYDASTRMEMRFIRDFIKDTSRNV